jgi:catechol 2,3-dioxygenase-like lactoylglutathione lyase family enzyme
LIEGLGYVWLEVRDLQRSVAFYRDGLRFALDERAEQAADRVHLKAGDLRLILSPAVTGTANSVGHGVTFQMDVAGVEAYHDALVARGLNPGPPIDDGAERSFTLRDPDGFEWRFHQSLA